MLKIGDFSRLTQVSVRMLRYYDELGLLKPERIDRQTGYRFYSAGQIRELSQIIELRDMGFLTSEIMELTASELTGEAMIRRLEEKKKELGAVISSKNEQVEKINRMLEAMDKEETGMNYEIERKSVPAYSVVSLREIIPAYNKEYLLWEKLARQIELNHIPCGGLCFAIYHDYDYRETEVDVEVAICVEGPLKKGETIPEGENIVLRETESVPDMATLMVSGAFENIAPAYFALAEWVEKNQYEIAGPTRQICHRGPWNETLTENYRTEIQIPVRAAEKSKN